MRTLVMCTSLKKRIHVVFVRWREFHAYTLSERLESTLRPPEWERPSPPVEKNQDDPLEAWHQKLNCGFQCAYSTWWTFFDKLMKEESNNLSDIINTVPGRRPTKRKNVLFFLSVLMTRQKDTFLFFPFLSMHIWRGRKKTFSCSLSFALSCAGYLSK